MTTQKWIRSRLFLCVLCMTLLIQTGCNNNTNANTDNNLSATLPSPLNQRSCEQQNGSWTKDWCEGINLTPLSCQQMGGYHWEEGICMTNETDCKSGGGLWVTTQCSGVSKDECLRVPGAATWENGRCESINGLRCAGLSAITFGFDIGVECFSSANQCHSQGRNWIQGCITSNATTCQQQLHGHLTQACMFPTSDYSIQGNTTVASSKSQCDVIKGSWIPGKCFGASGSSCVSAGGSSKSQGCLGLDQTTCQRGSTGGLWFWDSTARICLDPSEVSNSNACQSHAGFWNSVSQACQNTPTGNFDQPTCQQQGGLWYNNICYNPAQITNQSDCAKYGGAWINNLCQNKTNSQTTVGNPAPTTFIVAHGSINGTSNEGCVMDPTTCIDTRSFATRESIILDARLIPAPTGSTYTWTSNIPNFPTNLSGSRPFPLVALPSMLYETATYNVQLTITPPTGAPTTYQHSLTVN